MDSVVVGIWSLVWNSVVLAVYLLFSVACFFIVHEHSASVCHTFTVLSEVLRLPL